MLQANAVRKHPVEYTFIWIKNVIDMYYTESLKPMSYIPLTRKNNSGTDKNAMQFYEKR